MKFLDRAHWEGKLFTAGGWTAGSGGEYAAVEPATGRDQVEQAAGITAPWTG